MGALDTLNGTGAALALDNNGDIPETAIPATVARDTEINNGTLTFSGGATGTFTANQAGNTAITIPTANNGTLTVNSGTGLTGSGTFTANQAGNGTITLSHSDTSSQGSVNNSGSNFIQDITLDAFGHVTGITSAAAGGGTTTIIGTGSYVLMGTNRRNFAYNEGTTIAPNGDGNERYGVVYGDSGGSTSGGDFQQRTTTRQGGAISGGTWRSQSAGITNQRGIRLMTRIS